MEQDGPTESGSSPKAAKGDESMWDDRRTFALVGAVAAVYVVASFLGRLAATSGMGLRIAPGVAVALGLLFGPVAAWGAAVGYVFADLLSGTLAAATVVGYAAQFALVVSASRLWGAFGFLSDADRPGVPTVRNIGEYTFVAVTAATFASAVTAWGLLLVGESTFPAALALTLPDAVVSALTVGPLVLYGAVTLAKYRGVNSFSMVRGGSISGLFVLSVVLAWCLGGYAVGVVFQTAQTETRHAIVNHAGRFVGPILEFAGPGGLYLQAVGGGASLVLCLWGLRRV